MADSRQQPPQKADRVVSLASLSLNALKWNYLGSFSRSGLQFLIGILLARILGPEPFGLVAVAMMIVGLGGLFADFGLASALIQRRELTDDDICYVFTWQMLIGLALALLVFFSAPAVGRFFHEPSAMPVVQAISSIFFLQAFGLTASALLRRKLRFKQAQMVQIGSYLTGYVAVGIPLALVGMGVWSLVIAQILQTLLAAIASYALVRHPVGIRIRSAGKAGMFSFGMKVTLTNLGSWGFTSIDSLAIGRTFSTIDLGLYNRASTLVSNPMNVIVTSLQGVLFSTSARAQHNIPALRKTYLSVLSATGLICLPLFGSVAAIPEVFIGGIYGAKWAVAVPLLVPLALAQPVYALLALGGPIMTGIGKAGQEMAVQFMALVAFALMITFALRYSVEMVAWAALVAYVLRFILVTTVTLNILNSTWRAVAKSLTGSIFLGVVAAIVTWAADRWLGQFDLSQFVRLVASASAGALATLATLRVVGRWLIGAALRETLLAQRDSSAPMRACCRFMCLDTKQTSA